MVEVIRILSLLLAVSALLAAPSAANAKSYDWLPMFTKAATRFWGHGQNPACGQPRYLFVDTATLREDHPDGGEADADATTCQIRVMTTWWHSAEPSKWCQMAFHEIGHLYGHQHDEGGIMTADVWSIDIFPPCDALIVQKQWCKRHRNGRRVCHYAFVPATATHVRSSRAS